MYQMYHDVSDVSDTAAVSTCGLMYRDVSRDVSLCIAVIHQEGDTSFRYIIRYINDRSPTAPRGRTAAARHDGSGGQLSSHTLHTMARVE